MSYIKLLEATKSEMPKLEGKIELLWHIAAISDVPLIGVAEYINQSDIEHHGQMFLFLVPNYITKYANGDNDFLDVHLYTLSPESLDSLRLEQSRFRKEVGYIRDYRKIDLPEYNPPSKPESTEESAVPTTEDESQDSKKDKVRNRLTAEFRSELSYGELDVLPFGKVTVGSMTNRFPQQ